MRRVKTSRNGFSLTEILIVLVLLVTVAGLGISNIRRGLLGSSLRTAARELVADMDYARSIARAKCVPLSSGDSQQVRVRVIGGSSSATGYEVIDTTGRVVKKREFKSGITANFSNLTSANTIVYLAPGNIKGNPTGRIVVSVGGVSRDYVLEVNGATGLIRIKEEG